MKRLVLLGALALSALLVGLLYLAADEGRTGGRAAALSRDAEREGSTGGAGAEDEEGLSAAAIVGGGGTRAARDDDPNRIAGADLLLRGVVVRDGKRVPGAAVAVIRAFPVAGGVPSWVTGESGRVVASAALIGSTVADDQGAFTVVIARRSRLVVEARAKGHGAARKMLFMPAEGDPEPIVLDLGPPCALAGRVVTEAGEPVAGAAITLGTSSWRNPGSVETATSDGDGRFGFPDLAAGSYLLRTEAKGWPPSDLWVNLPLQKEMLVRLPKGGAIVGIVRDQAGAGVAGALVRIHSGDSSRGLAGWSEATCDAAGNYRIAAAMPGWVMAAVVRAPPSLVRSSAQEQIALPVERIQAGAEFRYEIAIERGVALRGVAVSQATGGGVPEATVTLLRWNEQYRSLFEISATRSGPDGRFEFAEVPAGGYSFDAKAQALARIVPRSATGQGPLVPDVQVGPDPPPETRVSMVAAGRVTGQVLGIAQEEIQRAGVQIQGGQNATNATLDDAARFEFDGVPEAAGLFLQSWNPQAKSDPFAVRAGETVRVDLDTRARRGFAGIVVDGEGNPLSGVRVRALVQNNLAQEIRNAASNPAWGGAVTDAEGRFTLDPPEWQRQNSGKQPWTLFATMRGYRNGIVSDLALPDGDLSHEIRVELSKGGTVSGRVEFAGGGGAPGIYVNVTPQTEKDAAPETRSALNAYTDFDGRFEVEGLEEGVYIATAFHAVARAENVKVEAGAKSVKLVLVEKACIEGIVVDDTGKPVPQFQISALVPTPSGEMRHGGGASGGGRFRIAYLEPGSYAVEVSPGTQPGEPRFEVTRSPPVATGTNDLVIRVGPGLTIQGRITGPDGGGVAGADVIALPAARPLSPRERQQAQSARRPHVRADSNGEFRLKGLDAEEVELLVIATGYEPATRMARPGPDRLKIELSSGETIEGRLLLPDRSPVASQWINLQPLEKATQEKASDWQTRGGQTMNSVGTWRATSTSTDGEGRFAIRGLPRGTYRPMVYRSDAVMPDVTLATGAGPQTIVLLAPASLKGRLVDAASGDAARPPAGQQWSVSARRGEQWLSGANVDPDGSFDIRGLPPGPLTIQVWAPPYQMRTMDVEAGGGIVTVPLGMNPAPRPPR